MGRNRRMPPLFEVMRQTNPGSSQPGPGPVTPGPAGAPGASPSDSARNQPFFRAPGQPQPDAPPHAGAALRLTPAPDTEGAPPPAAPRPSAAAAAPSVPKPVEVRVGQARRNWVVEDTSARADGGDDESGHDSRTARSGRGAGARAPLPIPGMWLAVGAAVAVTLIVVVWIVAYRLGSSAKEQEFQGKLSDSAPVAPSTPPSTSAGGAGSTPGTGGVPIEHRPAREPEGSAQPLRPEPGAGLKPPAPTPPPAAPVATDPAPAVDPRRAETNYLSVLTLRSKDDAVELAKYLTAGGLPAATVALKASGGTSTVGWEVFVLQGIASADFRRSDDTRNAIHRKLEELGRAWNQEGRSRLNLSRDNVTWRKHKPGS